jgi:hypothetical protein
MAFVKKLLIKGKRTMERLRSSLITHHLSLLIHPALHQHTHEIAIDEQNSLSYNGIHTRSSYNSKLCLSVLFTIIVTASIIEIQHIHQRLPSNHDLATATVPFPSNAAVRVLQRLFSCRSETECAFIAVEQILELLDTLKQVLHCDSPQQCTTMLRERYTPTSKQKDIFDQSILQQHVQQAMLRSQHGPAMDYGKTAPFITHHPAFEPMMEEFEPKEEWRNTTMSDLNIVGMRKTGTTHLYRLLQSHPKVTNFSRGKEKNSFTRIWRKLFIGYHGIRRPWHNLPMQPLQGASMGPKQLV